jgi:hypothetical protein
MPIVRRIFHLVADGTPLHAIKKRLEREGVAAPKGGKYWSRSYIRRVVNEDSYKPHTFEEIKALVSPEVASELDCSLDYGIWWFNQYRAQVKRGQSRKFSRKPREEWIAIPVVDAGIPRAWVDAAREAIDGNYRPPRTTRRVWELAGGVLFCGECGRRMIGHTVSAKRKNGTKLYHYYICPRKGWEYNRACPNRSHRAEEMETLIWRFTSGILCAPDQLEAGLDRMIERERDNSSGDTDREAKVWLEKLAEADRMRSGYQELAAKGLMSHEELGERLGQLGETRKTAERELEAVRERQERVEKLERDKDILLESYTTMVPEALNELAAQERYQVYKMLRLRVVVGTDGGCEVSGVLGEDLSVCTSGPTSTCSVSSTRPRPR